MNCPYCNATLEMSSKLIGFPRATVCIPCSCMFLVNSKFELIKTIFYLVHNTIDYTIELNYIKNTSKIVGPECPTIDKEMKEKSGNTHTRMIATLYKFPEIINITPISALNKLKLILNFS